MLAESLRVISWPAKRSAAHNVLNKMKEMAIISSFILCLCERMAISFHFIIKDIVTGTY